MVSKEEVPEFQGDVECPVRDCDETGSQLWTQAHFSSDHRVYVIRYAICEFFNDNTGDFKEYAETRDGERIWHYMEEYCRSAVENHPVFDVDLVSYHFGSAIDAHTHANEFNDEGPAQSMFNERHKILEHHRAKRQVIEESESTYGPQWGETRWSIYERDEFSCRLCDFCSTTYGDISYLDVHHITPASEFDSRTEMNDPSNLITLCKSCHGNHEGEYPDTTQDEWPDLVKEEEQLVQ